MSYRIKIISVSIVMVVLLVGVGVVAKGYDNKKIYNETIDASKMLKVNIDTINKKIIKNEDINKIKTDNINQYNEYKEKYKNTFFPSDDILQEITNVENSNNIGKNKLVEINNIIVKDAMNKFNLSIEEFNKIKDEKIKYNKTELNKFNKIVKSVGELKTDNIYDIYTSYDSLKNNKLSLTKLEKSAKARIKKEKEEKEIADSATSKTTSPSMSGNYDRANAQSLFNAINAYRTSLGLSPYAYATNQQSCVDLESKAYAGNNNPHNWVCSAADNENASYTAKGSDLVGITMDFFKNDPPHEAPMSGNYSSMAVSVYVANGMNYTIVDFFY